MRVADLLTALHQEIERRAYLSRLEMLDQSVTLLKARLYVSPNLFVQIYRNDQFDTTNLALIHNGERIYARDQLGGIWHLHTAVAPHLHDTSDEGRQAINLFEFLNEVESILARMELP